MTERGQWPITNVKSMALSVNQKTPQFEIVYTRQLGETHVVMLGSDPSFLKQKWNVIAEWAKKIDPGLEQVPFKIEEQMCKEEILSAVTTFYELANFPSSYRYSGDLNYTQVREIAELLHTYAIQTDASKVEAKAIKLFFLTLLPTCQQI